MATIQTRKATDGSVSYRVMVRRKGFPAQHATFARRTDAKAWANRIESDIDRGRHTTENEAKKHTLSDLIDRFLETVRLKRPDAYPKQRQLLLWWRDQLGEYSLLHLTPARISEMRDALLAENIGDEKAPRQRVPATANRYLAALSKACTVAVREWHWLHENPVSRVQKERESAGIVRYLSADEKNALLSACGKSTMRELELIVTLALMTGMRRGEIRGLRWPDVDLNRGTIVLHKTKNQERRAVPLAAQVRPLLAKHAQGRRLDTDLVFPGVGEDRSVDFDHAFIDAVREAQISDFRFHDLRHTAASYLAMSGATPTEIAAVLGHKTLAMVMRYAHLSKQHTGTVVERMTKKFFGDGKT